MKSICVLSWITLMVSIWSLLLIFPTCDASPEPNSNSLIRRKRQLGLGGGGGGGGDSDDDEDYTEEEVFNSLRSSVKLIEKEQLVLVEELRAALDMGKRPALFERIVTDLENGHYIVETWRNVTYAFRVMAEDKLVRACLQKASGHKGD